MVTATYSTAIGNRLSSANDLALSLVKRAAAERNSVNGSSVANILSANTSGVGGMFSQQNNSQSFAHAAEQYQHFTGHVFSAISVVAKRVAGQPACVAKVKKGKTKSRKSRDLETVEDHPLLAALEDPNDQTLRFGLIYVTVANIFLTGRCFWVMTLNSGKPEIYPVPTHWVRPSSKSVKHWTLYPPGSIGSDGLEVPFEQMAQFAFPDPSDPAGATSHLQAAGMAVLAAESIARSQKSGFDRGINPVMGIYAGDVAMPGGSTQVRLTPEQRMELLNWITREYSNAVNHGKPLIFDALIRDAKRLSTTNAEMDFMDSSKITEAHIYQGLGVNPISAGKVEGANKASSTVADEHLCNNTVNPIIELLSQGLTQWCVPFFTRKGDASSYVAWIEPAKAADSEEQSKMRDLATKAGAVKVNEVREWAGLDPLPDGDVLLKPAAVAKPQPQPQKEGEEPPAEPQTVESGDIGAEAETAKKKAFSPRNDWRDAHAEIFLKANDHGEHDLQTALEEDVFSPAGKRIIAGLEGINLAELKPAGVVALTKKLFDAAAFGRQVKKVARKQCEKLMRDGVQLALNAIDPVKRRRQAAWSGSLAGWRKYVYIPIPPDILQAVVDALDEVFAQPYWDAIPATTVANIQGTILAGITSGQSTVQITQAIASAMGVSGPSAQAANIAQTEVTAALNAGQYAAIENSVALGNVSGSEWFGIMDAYIRPSHQANNGVVAPAGTNFNVGGHAAPYPGHWSLPARERCQCRCTIAPVMVD